jgi:hypothetical protein
MFSITTIESSTTRPVATVSAPRVMTLRVMPSRPSRSNAVRTDRGMETAAMTVDRQLRRKSRMTMKAKNAPSMPSRSMPSVDAWIAREASYTVTTCDPWGRLARSLSISVSAALETLTVLASCVFVTSSSSAGLPLALLPTWASPNP